MTDKIYISGLAVPCIIGIYPREQDAEQFIRIDLEITGDFGLACKSDNIVDTIDYERLEQQMIRVCRGRPHNLIEHLAQEIADVILQDKRILAVKVNIKKPESLKHSDFAAVEIIREQS